MSVRQRRKRDKRRRHGGGRRRAKARIVAGAGLGVTAALGAGTTAHAADFAVNAGDDAGDGTCDPAPGGCTLRDALDDAAANDNSPTVDQILFDSSVTGTITLNGTQLPTIDEPLYVDGPGAEMLTISGNNASRILSIYIPSGPGARDVTVSGLTLSAGKPSGDGGAINSVGANLTVNRVTISGSSASGGGGLRSSAGTTKVESSTISGNSASNNGGGVLAFGGLSVRDSTISGNSASGGGGVYARSGAVTVEDSTISGNKANTSNALNSGGGGLFASGARVTIQTSTISGNSGGGVSVQGLIGKYGSSQQGVAIIRDSTVSGNTNFGVLAAFQERNPTVANTIVADNSGDLATLSGTAGETFEAAFSLIENPAGAPISDTTPGSNITGIDPQLSPLADNGGATKTQALPETSPAVDQGSSELNNDQRGMPRGVNLPAPGESEVFGANCADIGAFEFQLPDGGTGPGCHSDVTAPETELTNGPKNKRKNKKALFAFTSSEPNSSFECKLDDGVFEPCGTPEKVRVKGRGEHHFEVRAIDATGNVDPTPAGHDWRLKKKKKQGNKH